MSSDPTFVTGKEIRLEGASVLEGWLRKLVHVRLESLRLGSLKIVDPLGVSVFHAPEDPLGQASLLVHDCRFYRDVVLGGGLGAARSYMEGRWDCDDLTRLFRIFLQNMDILDGFDSSPASRLGLWMARAGHRRRANKRLTSRRNIREHYDLGNELFRLFLDPTMTYSAGIFETPEASMEQASIAKLERICRKLRLTPDDHVLEIGSGWGSFAIHAAREYGCQVTTTTISDEQYHLAGQRIREAGLSHRVRLLKSDYRDLKGSFDKLVSIEMVEAVGHRYLPRFFAACSRLLKPEGLMVLQSITLPDQRYAYSLRSVDFIQHFIFPGSCVPSMSALLAAITEGSDLRVSHVEDIGLHYEKTLRCWRDRFNENLGEVRRLGYSEDFLRLWDYYFAYCEAGFAERYLGDLQMVLHRPACRVAPILASLS